MALNVTTAVIGSGCNAATASPSLAQWDRGQILQLSGVELPETYKVEFSNEDTLEAIPSIGTAEGVEIPDKLLYSSSPIRAYIVLSEAEGERNTEYWVTIYVKPREIPEGIEPDPDQQDVIDDLIAQLNTGVRKAEDAADAAEESAGEAEAASQAVQDLGVRAETAASGAPAAVQKIVDAETGAVTLVFFLPQGEAGVSPVVTVTTITGGHRVTVTDSEGAHSFDVMDGEDGRSVTGVTMGADYKLTFTFSDGTTWTTPTSIRGETGATPRLTIGTVSTLDPGQSATAEITGTPEDPVLNFGIPKGQAGASDAGGVTYDPTETYQSGTAGAALNDLSRQISDLEDTVSTTQIINTASGAIASFDDGADNMPIRKLVAQIEPVQDLHGYDHPWPAGGGANKLLPMARSDSWTTNGINITYDADTESFSLRGTNTMADSAWIILNGSSYLLTPLLNGITYYFAHNLPSGTYGQITYNKTGGGVDVLVYLNGDGSFRNVSFTLPADFVSVARVQIGIFASTTTINASGIQYGVYAENPTSWSPYSNICPISGHTGAEVEQRGKNLFAYDGVYTSETSGTIVERKPMKIPKGTYCFTVFGSIGNAMQLTFTNENSIRVGTVIIEAKEFVNGKASKAITITGESAIVNLYSSGSYNITALQLEFGSEATDYEPFQSDQISVDWEDAAGTVYGGTLTLNPDRTGALVVDKVKVTIDGDTVRFNGKLGADNVAVPAVQLNLFGLPASVAYNNQIASNYLKKWTTAIATEPNTFNA